ncbi:flagellin [Candidatus Marinarcus aquaticus]|uniref:Flagellin n=1 Tax=Candidatus Marinarcus aquaticus TaxID=2044504 RepID=A0A4Q0XTU9_9BACT|nr:flagellin [Candidatus Marinarcus aquaticus]RXJ60325.1 flagellin [Candidatus Marinarcus aquaticus]
MTINNTNNLPTYDYNNNQLNGSLNRIATGLLINQASDNAASLAISENLKVQASGLSQSLENVNSALALTQIGDRAFDEQSNILDSVKSDLLKASTATTSQEGREALLSNIQKGLEQLNNIASTTNYNGTTLLQADATDTSASQSLEFQAGEGSADTIETTAVQANTTGLGLDGLLNQDPATFDASTAQSFLDTVDDALTQLNSYRADFGSTANQLQSANSNLATQYTNTVAANSVLIDLNYANEVSNFSKQNILAQVGALGLAQSNNITQQTVLRLLQ